MALIDAPLKAPFVRGRRTYVRAPVPKHFPSEERLDEAVPETKRHLEVRTTLYLLLKDAFTFASIGSEQFVYWDATDPKRCLSPDVFVKLGARDDTFDIWKTWERSAPDLAVEIVSPSDRRDADWEEKLERYGASGIAEVVRFDPLDEKQPIRVWDRMEDDLVERAPESTHLRECVALHLWWTVVDSDHGPSLRLAHDRSGAKLLPTPDEERVRLAEELAEERKARSLAEHARMVAEHERMLEEQKRTRAEQERTLAEEARLAEQRAREAAEQSLREESDARARERAAAAAEIQRLKEELAQARGERR